MLLYRYATYIHAFDKTKQYSLYRTYPNAMYICEKKSEFTLVWIPQIFKVDYIIDAVNAYTVVASHPGPLNGRRKVVVHIARTQCTGVPWNKLEESIDSSIASIYLAYSCF